MEVGGKIGAKQELGEILAAGFIWMTSHVLTIKINRIQEQKLPLYFSFSKGGGWEHCEYVPNSIFYASVSTARPRQLTYFATWPDLTWQI